MHVKVVIADSLIITSLAHQLLPFACAHANVACFAPASAHAITDESVQCIFDVYISFFLSLYSLRTSNIIRRLMTFRGLFLSSYVLHLSTRRQTTGHYNSAWTSAASVRS